MKIDLDDIRGVVVLDQYELAVRLCCACHGLMRPDHLTAQEAIESMEPEVAHGWMNAARAAVAYLSERIMESGMTKQ